MNPVVRCPVCRQAWRHAWKDTPGLYDSFVTWIEHKFRFRRSWLQEDLEAAFYEESGTDPQSTEATQIVFMLFAGLPRELVQIDRRRSRRKRDRGAWVWSAKKGWPSPACEEVGR
jgi:hypothetical protein